jgi:16S rRNA (cytosine967-C5)-methyltransferase
VTARQIAYRTLIKVDSGGFSGKLLAGSDNVTPAATALVYGVTKRRFTLDYIIRQNSATEFDKLDSEVRNALRLGLYLLLYDNGTPESAAVNEAVALVPPHRRAFVNAVLRNFVRKGKQVDTGEVTDDYLRTAIKYSCPRRLVKLFCEQYGEQTATQILEESLKPRPTFIKVNTIRFTPLSVKSALESEGVYVNETKFTDVFTVSGGAFATTAYHEGMFFAQDISPHKFCRRLGITGGTVLDVCSAPGGKAFAAADLSGGRAAITACDVMESKTKVIEESANRLRFTGVRATLNDGLVFNEDLPQADVVLVDAPCSGLGVIGRKPEIKYRDSGDFSLFTEKSLQLLSMSARYVKPNGRLAFSTCTLNKTENENVVAAFLSSDNSFKLTEQQTYILGEDNGDGLFFAIMQKKDSVK